MSDWQKVTHKKTKNPNSVPDPDAQQPEYYSESNTVIFRKNKPVTTTVTRTTQPNYKSNINNSQYHKIINSTSADKHKTVSAEVARMLNKTLVAKKWSQDDLVAKVGGKAGVNKKDVQSIASGIAINNDAKLTAIENALNMHLRGKFSGTPMRKEKEKKK